MYVKFTEERCFIPILQVPVFFQEASVIMSTFYFSVDTISLLVYEHNQMSFCRRVIWLGDLNYRINLSYEKTHELIARKEWQRLLENDQVRLLHLFTLILNHIVLILRLRIVSNL